MIVDKKRYPMFELRKVRRDYPQAQAYAHEDYLALIYTRARGRGRGQYHIDLNYGGKLATSFDGRNFFKGSYPLAFSKLTPKQQDKVRAAVLHIVKHGDPIDNDEGVFA